MENFIFCAVIEPVLPEIDLIKIRNKFAKSIRNLNHFCRTPICVRRACIYGFVSMCINFKTADLV